MTATAAFAERLKLLRAERELSQTDIARLLGVTRSTYQNWEVGRAFPPEERLSAIADLFGTSVDYLMGRTEVRATYRVPDDLPRDVLAEFAKLPEEARRILVNATGQLSADDWRSLARVLQSLVAEYTQRRND
jgi:transcriptional regulator with XRE-family HTH domain